ncbi:uncharacterized protein LOC106094429 [Stomoxys calcitrans]|uniref:uncharacterized protein LOC106094429 n=1 Tax=Stomoxys calcitrans TaxID=35570 RepID=UPI0027E28606|nr:uncharacterized protein LOC106094429 [Stomoxys calcitrans]XP_059216496.1 uncharacterized protein LOC106094429 [Stomoxys calcitrans]
MPTTLRAMDAAGATTATSSSSALAAAARAALSTAYHYNNTILLPSLEQRLHTPPATSSLSPLDSTATATASSSSSSSSSLSILGPEINRSTGLTSISHVASVVVSNFLPLSTASLSPGDDSTSADDTKYLASSYSSLSSPATATATAAAASLAASATTTSSGDALSSALPLPSSSSLPSSASASVAVASSSDFFPSYSPPVVESLVASSAEDFSNNFRDLSFDIFDDNDNDLFGSPMAFDASENGLWNGRFVPPPPRPPFFVDEPVLSDGLTTCDLCSWAMPTKSTFIFEGTMEKASELGWPLTLTIVSILSAILGAIIMIAVVKCRRKKTSHQRSDTHVQWWSRNKRPNGNNNHLRRSNIYTAHPVDSIRGLQQPNSLSASSSMTAMTTAMAVGTAPPNAAGAATLPFYHHHHHHHHQQQHDDDGVQQQQHGIFSSYEPHQHQQQHHSQHHLEQQYHQQEQHYFEHEHEYHQPQELQLQLQQQRQPTTTTTTATMNGTTATSTLAQLKPSTTSSYHSHNHGQPQQQQHQQQQHLHPQHQHQYSGASMSSTSTSSMPSLSCMPLQRQIPEQLHLQTTASQPQHVLHQLQQQHPLHHHHQQQQQHEQHELQQNHEEHSPDLHHDNLFHWPTATSLVTS